jgi:hypothetical protein
MTPDCCPVVELRQYTLLPGQRDILIRLFDREFVESQEAVGIHVLGQFRDADAPDRFVWLRGFPDMDARRRSLTAFYGGPVWREHRGEANATMVDSDDVMLLRPVSGGSGFSLPGERPPAGASEAPGPLVTATIYSLDAPVEDFVWFFEREVGPVMADTGSLPIARFRTEPAENTFPQLPVRTGESVFVWFADFESAAHHGEHLARLARSRAWREVLLPELSRRLSASPRHLRLEPTARSLLGRRDAPNQQGR